MARRRQRSIEIYEIDPAIRSELVSLLKKIDQFTNIDLSSIKITGLEIFTSKFKKIDEAANNVDNFIQINGDRIVSASKFAKICKIARLTLDRWIEADIFFREDGTSMRCTPYRYNSYFKPKYKFKLSTARDQLIKVKKQ